MMFCSSCGQRIDDDSRFCRHCGAAQDSTAAPAPAANAGTAAPSGEAAASRPGSGTGRIVGIAAAALLGLVVVGSIVGGSRSPDAAETARNAEMLADNLEMQADNMVAMADTTSETARGGTWSYSTDVDKVRGGTSYFASTTSTNTIHQDAPYDPDTSMQMTVRRMPAAGTDVVLTISSGQLMCPSYEGCSGTVRFDDGPAQRVRFNGPADSSSDTIFVVGAKAFVGKLKKARKVIVEKTLYEAGNPQFEFDVSGLKWEH